MRIGGAMILRNGITFDYPFREALRSLAPIVDQIVVCIDPGEDSTLQEVQTLSKNDLGPEKIKIVTTKWPLLGPEKKFGGQVLSDQTNLALSYLDTDWAIVLQADEVLHESQYDEIKTSLSIAHQTPEIDGIAFGYHHFYGSYGVEQVGRGVYRREIRAIRLRKNIVSVGDAQSFKYKSGHKITALLTGAKIFHYGWVRNPRSMKEKTFFMDQLYHQEASSQSAQEGTPFTGTNYKYKKIMGLIPFRGTHPKLMEKRIREKNWQWELDKSQLVWTFADIPKWFLNTIEKWTGIRFFEYKPFKLVNPQKHSSGNSSA